ncbi:hypothetical protein [Dictyobacter arantiisoli]|uniref:Uncharacterized protein n=1 Tax=Dictyobacter arantiisoli TaxID=2014874 RepID=A0A5A5T761_9CHLR|nr:hypothetical protein [Dictyobacter arantiisoli]GCF06774.1 hypothetical protein KDI_03380 [Dictyobacter arantiisoli]
MKPIKAVYYFIVGDMIILIGILIAVVLLLLIDNVGALTSLRSISAPLFVIITVISLVATLAREAYSSKRH